MKTTRRPPNPRDAAAAVFKPARKEPQAPVERPAVPYAKELVSLKLDREVLAYFQSGGPRWQDRINDALKAAMKHQQLARDDVICNRGMTSDAFEVFSRSRVEFGL